MNCGVCFGSGTGALELKDSLLDSKLLGVLMPASGFGISMFFFFSESKARTVTAAFLICWEVFFVAASIESLLTKITLAVWMLRLNSFPGIRKTLSIWPNYEKCDFRVASVKVEGTRDATTILSLTLLL